MSEATIAVPEVSEKLETSRTLTAEDRCDRCGAQAYVATEHSGLELLWCAHHAGKNEVQLTEHITLDERSKLNS